MSRLEELNGQQVVIDAVLARRNTSVKEIIVAVGSPGTGITWMLERAAEAWEKSEGAALQARGEPFATERKLFPWLTLILPKTKRLARLEVLKGSVSQGSRLVPVVGSITGYLLDELLNHRKRRLAREAVVLTEQEQDLLFVIQTAAQRKRLLLTIDHLNVWDESSWNLLGMILSPSLHELYPVLSDALILVGACREIPERLRSLSAKLPVSEFKVRPLEQEEMSFALSAFGLPRLTRTDMDQLYDITDGRVDLLYDFCKHLRETSLAGDSSSRSDLYDRMISRRLQSLKGNSSELEELLAAAAVLGQTFAVDDIRCLTGYPKEKIEGGLRLAVAEHLLNVVGEISRFQSAALHRHFHHARAGEHAKYHGKFADCLQTMRPAEYEYRLHHLKLAGRMEEALVCYALDALMAKRQHGFPPEPGELQGITDWEEVRAYLEAMYTAYDAYEKRRLSESLEVLDRIEGFLPDALIAERDYLEAQILLKSHHIASFQRAAEILSRWQGLKSREGELWSRIMQVLIVALVQTDHIGEARHLEAEITTHYWSRRKVDPWALYSLNILRRRAECLHQFPAATLRLESALNYFAPQEREALPRHPFQYYYTLTNLIGNLAASGRFEEAYARALELDELVRNHPQVPWPTLEIAVNNFVLSGYLSGNLNASSSADLMGQVLTGLVDERGDRILMENNHAVYLVRVGAKTEAQELLERTYTEVIACSEPDAYHMYFVGNNLAAMRALEGAAESAEQLRREIGQKLERFYPAIRQTLERRHELLEPAFADAPQLGVGGFDSYLMDNYPSQLGPQWAFYGRGFLLTDIQFWSAD